MLVRPRGRASDYPLSTNVNSMPHATSTRLFGGLVFISLLAACGGAGTGDGTATAPERAAYLTLMGNDTLAIEWVEFGDNSVDADALVRGSRTTFTEYHLEHSDAGELTEYMARVHAGGSADAPLIRTEQLVRTDSGPVLVIDEDGETEQRAIDAPAGSVPFVDMLHWPFETALRWQAEQGGFRDEIPTFTGRGMRFGLSRNDDGGWSLRHPSRGPSTMQVDSAGRILTLDGTGSTRAYQLMRTEWDALDREALGRTFADRPLGELSGRGEIDTRVAGVQFTGDYGTPVRRGRDIFGGLLAYGVRWRTGANRATHLAFDRDLLIDGQTVPAGEYTLFTIPEQDGGTLVINRQTGQTGTSYDEAQDQARVQLRRDSLDETVETFQIRVVPADVGGRIELRWDDTVYWVPFTAG